MNKPEVYFIFPENDDNLYIDYRYFESLEHDKEWNKWGPWGKPWDGLVLGLGKNVFLIEF